MSAHAPKALLFDLGGVVVDIDFNRALHSWQAYSTLSFDELKRRYHFDPAYESHERGEIPPDEYFAHIAANLELSATPAQVEIGWNAIFKGEITQTRLLIEQARRQIPCYAFTNTNASHKANWSSLFPAVVSAFDKIYASHQIGLRKPELTAFEHICKDIRLDPSSILFFDDLPQNVEAAATAGLQAVLVRTPDDVAASLLAHGVATQ